MAMVIRIVNTKEAKEPKERRMMCVYGAKG
jgi:hypothetical protein